MNNDTVAVGGVWLYAEVDENYARGPDRWVVAVEVDGTRRRYVVEQADGVFLHVIEPSGIRRAPLDPRGVAE